MTSTMYNDTADVAQDIDLAKIFLNNQQSNLDDYVEFEIYFDEFLSPTAELDEDLGDAPALTKKAKSKRAIEGLDSVNPTPDISVSEVEVFKRLLAINAHLAPLIASYSWTSAPMFLEVVSGSSTVPPHVRGTIRVGDNVMEEWFIVYVLRHLTTIFADISVSIRDADGEFILIEAAYNLPKWLNPQTAVNRIFFRKGNLHIVPRNLPNNSRARNLSNGIFVFDVDDLRESSSHNLEEIAIPPVAQALQCLRSDQFGQYTAKAAVQKTIYRRAKGFETIVDCWFQQSLATSQAEKLSAESICLPHICNAVLPFHIAALMRRFPHILGVALDHLPPSTDFIKLWNKFTRSGEKGTSNKDDENLTNACMVSHKTSLTREISSFSFDCSDDNVSTVMTPLTFNRCQYARLKQLSFKVPARFMLSEWRLPSVDGIPGSCVGREVKHSNIAHKEAMELGAKICLGLAAAYFSNRSTSVTSLMSFFWGSSKTQLEAQISAESLNVITQDRMVAEVGRINNFLCLLNQAAENANETDKQSRPCILWIRLFKLLHRIDTSVKGIDTSMSQETLGRLGSVQFNHVIDLLLSKYKAEGLSSLCWCKANCKGSECFHVNQENSDESWLNVSSEEVEALMEERQREDNFHKALEEQLKVNKPNIDLPPVKYTKPEAVFQDVSSDKTKADVPNKFTDIDPEMAVSETLSMVERFLNKESNFEGIELGQPKRRLDKEVLLKLFSDSYADLIEDICDVEDEDEDEDEDEGDEVDFEGSDGNEDENGEEDENDSENSLQLDKDMAEIMKLMDLELATFKTKQNIPKRINEILEESESEGSDSVGDCKKSFRGKSPAEMSDRELAEILSSNMSRSKIEELPFEPGPTRILEESLKF